MNWEEAYNKHWIAALWNWSGNEESCDPVADVHHMIHCDYSGDIPICLYLNEKTDKQLDLQSAFGKPVRDHIADLIQSSGMEKFNVSEDVPDNRAFMLFLDGNVVGLNTEPHHFLTTGSGLVV
jgi:hypothetical protein